MYSLTIFTCRTIWQLSDVKWEKKYSSIDSFVMLNYRKIHFFLHFVSDRKFNRNFQKKKKKQFQMFQRSLHFRKHKQYFVTVVNKFVLCNSFMLWNECVLCRFVNSSSQRCCFVFVWPCQNTSDYALLLFYLCHQTVRSISKQWNLCCSH